MEKASEVRRRWFEVSTIIARITHQPPSLITRSPIYSTIHCSILQLCVPISALSHRDCDPFQLPGLLLVSKVCRPAVTSGSNVRGVSAWPGTDQELHLLRKCEATTIANNTAPQAYQVLPLLIAILQAVCTWYLVAKIDHKLASILDGR